MNSRKIVNITSILLAVAWLLVTIFNIWVGNLPIAALDFYLAVLIIINVLNFNLINDQRETIQSLLKQNIEMSIKLIEFEKNELKKKGGVKKNGKISRTSKKKVTVSKGTTRRRSDSNL